MSDQSPQDNDPKKTVERGDAPETQAAKSAESADNNSKDSNKAQPESATQENKPSEKTKEKCEESVDKEESAKSEPWVSEETISHLFDRISGVTSSALKFAKKTTGTSYKVGKAIIQSQDQLKLMVTAGQSLKDLREVAGLTVSELSEAINLKDKSLLEAVENGTATLSFELILRLSALLARNDPIPFILKYSRTYSPETWKLLNDWGAGRLPLQYQREREFINIFRSQDQARQLSDDGFNKVLEFTRHAFNLSLHFIAEQEESLEVLKQEALENLIKEQEAQLKKAKNQPTDKATGKDDDSAESTNPDQPA